MAVSVAPASATCCGVTTSPSWTVVGNVEPATPVATLRPLECHWLVVIRVNPEPAQAVKHKDRGYAARLLESRNGIVDRLHERGGFLRVAPPHGCKVPFHAK